MFTIVGATRYPSRHAAYQHKGVYLALLCLVLMQNAGAADAAEPVAVCGTVSDVATNEGLPKVDVTIEDDSGTILHTLTDSHGVYRAIGLSFGTINVSVLHAGYAPEAQRCYVTSGDTLRLDVGLLTRYTNIGRRRFPCVVEPRTSDLYRR